MIEVQELVSVGETIPTTIPNAFRKDFDKLEGELSHDVAVSSSIPVHLFSEYAELTLSANNRKQISYKDFREMLGRIAVTNELPSLSGTLLPSSVIYIAQAEKKLYLNTYYAGCNRQMIYGSEKINIVTPNIIISFILSKDRDDWTISQVNYFCTDLPISKLPKEFIGAVKHSDHIFCLPMSNTYAEGTMCYGSNSMPARFKDNNLRGLDYYFRYLWDTPFNSDLGIRAARGDVSVSGWYSNLKALALTNSGFPYDRLKGYLSTVTNDDLGTENDDEDNEDEGNLDGDEDTNDGD